MSKRVVLNSPGHFGRTPAIEWSFFSYLEITFWSGRRGRQIKNVNLLRRVSQMVASPAFVDINISFLCFNCEESARFLHFPWVRRHKHTFPLESISMPRITRPDSWAVNNITNIRACLDSAEWVCCSDHFRPWLAPTVGWKVMKVYRFWEGFCFS